MKSPSQPNPVEASSKKWNYVEIDVLDDGRLLHPTHVCSTEIIFKTPPALASRQIEVVIINNGNRHSSQAHVLPHDPNATRIPIQLIASDQSAPAKLTA